MNSYPLFLIILCKIQIVPIRELFFFNVLGIYKLHFIVGNIVDLNQAIFFDLSNLFTMQFNYFMIHQYFSALNFIYF